jgi:hypothetical protein
MIASITSFKFGRRLAIAFRYPSRYILYRLNIGVLSGLF